MSSGNATADPFTLVRAKRCLNVPATICLDNAPDQTLHVVLSAGDVKADFLPVLHGRADNTLGRHVHSHPRHVRCKASQQTTHHRHALFQTPDESTAHKLSRWREDLLIPRLRTLPASQLSGEAGQRRAHVTNPGRNAVDGPRAKQSAGRRERRNDVAQRVTGLTGQTTNPVNGVIALVLDGLKHARARILGDSPDLAPERGQSSASLTRNFGEYAQQE